MKKLSKVNVADLLGPASIASTSDREIWSQLISPQTKSLLGSIDSTVLGPKSFETDTPLFPGDEVSNLNKHLLYGGQQGFVRFPFVATIYKTTYGYLVIKRDFCKFKVSAWIGDIFKGKGELIFKYGLRDRRFDGTRRANDCSLLDFPYDGAGNTPMPLSGVEISIYAFAPGSRIVHACGDAELEAFVANPFKFLDKPDNYLKLFERAWKTQRAPGQIGASIPDVAKFVAPRSDKIALRKGYDFIEDAASHYHVAMFALASGYRCTFTDQAEKLATLRAGIERIKASGVALTRPQESWVCALQSLPAEMIPAQLRLNSGFTWMQDNISQENLWMNKPLSAAAQKLIPGPISRELYAQLTTPIT